MKVKEGRDFLSFKECVASLEEDGSVVLSNLAETFTLSKAEFSKLVAFVKQKMAQQAWKE